MKQWLNKNVGGHHGHFIAGQWDTSGESLSLHNPADKTQSLGEFAQGSATDASRALEAAQDAATSWAHVPAPQRGEILFKAANLLESAAEDMAHTVSAEQGKVLAESFGEVKRAVQELRFCAGETSRINGQTLPSEKPDATILTLREPLGVVVAITPWNFPLIAPIRKIGPALAYGCTMVLKPSSYTPWSSVKLMTLFQSAGVPDGVLNLVMGSGHLVGEPLINDDRTKGITFTGSTPTGANIAAAASRRFTRTQLEMGGKNPAVVLGYKDVAAVANQITSAAFACSGQRCTAISRVIVLDSLHDELVQALIGAMAAINVGPAWAPNTTMGPLINEAQLNSVCLKLKAGLAEGGQVISGGEVLNRGELAHGYFLQPTLVDNISPSSCLATDEIFGPVLSVLRAADAEEAFVIANSTNYGLAASIFTQDYSTAMRFANASETGMVHVNHGTASEAHIPFGGVKQSGWGAYSIGHNNQEFFTTQKAVYLKF